MQPEHHQLIRYQQQVIEELRAREREAAQSILRLRCLARGILEATGELHAFATGGLHHNGESS